MRTQQAAHQGAQDAQHAPVDRGVHLLRYHDNHLRRRAMTPSRAAPASRLGILLQQAHVWQQPGRPTWPYSKNIMPAHDCISSG
jgi:hypothetical protein